MKNNMIRNSIIAGILVVLVCVGIGFSFAFFTAGIEGNDTAETMTITAGTIELTFADNNTFNFDKAQPGDFQEKTFTVQNTGTLDDSYSYNIKLTDLSVTFQGEDLVYILQEYTDDSYDTPKEGGVNNTGFINNDILNEEGEMYLATKIERPTSTGDKHYYKLTIKFDNLEGVNQKYNFGAKFSGKVNVDDSKDAKVYKKAYTITTSITNGTVEPSEMDVIPEQDSEVFTIKPEDRYVVKDVTCTNDQEALLTESTFKVANVTNDSVCTVSLAKMYKITIKSSGNYEGVEFMVEEGMDSEQFTLPSSIDDCVTMGLNCSSNQKATYTDGNYQFKNVTSDIECTVSTGMCDVP